MPIFTRRAPIYTKPRKDDRSEMPGKQKTAVQIKLCHLYIIHINCKFFKGKKPLKAVARNIYTIAQKKAAFGENDGQTA